MKYGICALSVVPCRFEPSDKSEMVNQLLFGDYYKVIDERAKWVKVRTAHDQYEGWIDRKQYKPITELQFKQLESQKEQFVNLDLAAAIKHPDNSYQTILMGSSLHFYTQGNFGFPAESTFSTSAMALNTKIKSAKSKLVENAMMYLNAPYLWGGRSPFGIDCSGFSQMVYKMNGIALPRDAKDQALLGDTLSFIEESTPGDLAFFDNADGDIIHVGIMLENHSIIHASGKVRIDRLDHQGIYMVEEKKYSHNLRVIKKIVKDE